MTLIPYPISCGDTTAHIYDHPTFSGRPATSVLFLLHGYPANVRHMTPVVDRIFSILTSKSRGLDGNPCSNLVVVTLENNEKSRLLMDDDPTGEAEYVYRAQERLAFAVSSMIGLLPNILHPNTPEVVNTWAVTGLGLGAHAAWMVMDRGMHPFPCYNPNPTQKILTRSSRQTLAYTPVYQY
ncbi:unnamed protein product [Rhizoctonia solani]|uniref:Uncharacterized protein n=1 Tax=Rhizoctonia solani TaxID=456999 RepID=A0A8H3BZ26_9AGAM|nr:unnamed protein product [Rhizoctonia solani]